jgi:predicted O-linked N-acetylglucosamine transferase (SPINDLY family)
MSQLNIRQAFDLALQHQRAGRLREAEFLYRQILSQDPDNVDATHMLGLIAHQVGQLDVAAQLIRRAIALHPNFPHAYINLGNVLRDDSRLDEAIQATRKAIVLDPKFAEAYVNLGTFLKDNGQLNDAIAANREALNLNPNLAGAHCNLGTALQAKGQLDEAVAAYRNAIALDPEYALAYGHLGNVLRDKGRIEEAIVACRQAIALNPALPEPHNYLGIALANMGRRDQAITAYHAAIALKPGYAQAYNNLGTALNELGQLDEAIAASHRAIALDPNLAEAHSNLGRTLQDCGRLDEAIAAFRKALELNPALVAAHDNLLFALQYHPDSDPRNLFAQSQQWDRIQTELLKQVNEPRRPVPVQAHSASSVQARHNARTTDRRLRIGYVSGDFRDHPVARFALPLLGSHDHGGFEIFCYAHVLAPDSITLQFQKYADGWRNIVGMSDAAVADAIRLDEIDILVDLAGHTDGNRLPVFARKPAPVQVTYLGYPATTGLKAIDYRFTDELADPPGLADSYCSERLIRLPQCAWCFQPPEISPAVGELPARRNGYITFGSFNNFSKINEPLLKLWAEILLRTPQSRLLLKAKSLRCASVQQYVVRVMGDLGIGAQRLDMRGWVPAGDHLAVYNQVDIGLDTYPYHGTTTTCEALWMGVPVITLAGQSHVSRVGVSLLSNVGHADFIGQIPEQYADAAVRLAGDLPKLEHERSSLRQRMGQSPLMDAPKFARSIEAAYRLMWQTSCEGERSGVTT